MSPVLRTLNILRFLDTGLRAFQKKSPQLQKQKQKTKTSTLKQVAPWMFADPAVEAVFLRTLFEFDASQWVRFGVSVLGLACRNPHGTRAQMKKTIISVVVICVFLTDFPSLFMTGYATDLLQTYLKNLHL
jgi:hypothetical protein